VRIRLAGALRKRAANIAQNTAPTRMERRTVAAGTQSAVNLLILIVVQ
jgi:hypothetical protein